MHDVVDAVGVADERGCLVLVLLILIPDTDQPIRVPTQYLILTKTIAGHFLSAALLFYISRLKNKIVNCYYFAYRINWMVC